MKTRLRLVLAGALLAATAIASGPVPTLAASTQDTIVVTCSNGFSRTVSAKAARGVARSLTAFNAHRGNGITCAAAPGAPRVAAATFQTVGCSDGFSRKVNAKAIGPIVKALNAFNARRANGVTCAVVP
jgi:hypothetical protein